MDLLYECRQYGNRGLNTGTDSITIIIIVTFKCNIRHAESLKTFIKVKIEESQVRSGHVRYHCSLKECKTVRSSFSVDLNVAMFTVRSETERESTLRKIVPSCR